jgi:hypothetical protein
MGQFRAPHNNKRCNSHTLTTTATKVKFMELKWAGYEAQIGKRNVRQFLWKKKLEGSHTPI